MALRYDEESGQYTYEPDPAPTPQVSTLTPEQLSQAFRPSAENNYGQNPMPAALAALNPASTQAAAVTQPTQTPQTSGGGAFDPNALRAALAASGMSATPANLKQFLASHPEFAGVTIGGSKGNQLFYNGQYLAKVIQGTSGPNPMWAWDTSTDSGDSGGNAIDPSYLSPFTPSPPSGSPLPNYTPPPAFQYDDFGGFDQWNPTTAQDVYADPSYAFRRDEGKGVLENSAAAKGLFNSGGTLVDLLKYGQQFASNEYGNVDTRRFNAWDTSNANKLNTYTTNRNNAAQNYATNYGVGRDTYQSLVNNNETEYQRQQRQWESMRDQWYSNQTNPANKLLALTNLGYDAAQV